MHVPPNRPDLQAILVIVPFNSIRLGDNYTVPDWLEDYGHGVTVVRTQEDWGPAGKLIPAVAISMMPRAGPAAAGEWLHAPPYAQGKIRTRGGGLAKMTPRTRIITFDDDRIYKPWLVELYTIVSLRRPGCMATSTFFFLFDILGPMFCALRSPPPMFLI